MRRRPNEANHLTGADSHPSDPSAQDDFALRNGQALTESSAAQASPESIPEPDDNAPVAEDEIYTKVDPDDLVTRFYRVHRIGKTYFIYKQNEEAESEAEQWYFTGLYYETEPASGHQGMLRHGFKWFNQEWWKS